MGKRGPRPEPTTLKLLKGNPGKRALNTNEPRPTGCLPKCPEHLSESASEAWHTWATDLEECGIATRLDATAFELLCAAYARYLDAAEKVSQGGAVWVEKGEGKIPKFVYSPYWAVMKAEFKNVRAMLQEFGMTPSSRSGVEIASKPTGVRRRQG